MNGFHILLAMACMPLTLTGNMGAGTTISLLGV
jgi:hypothetical protein